MKLKAKTYRTWKIHPRRLAAFIDSFTVYEFDENLPVRLNPEGFFEFIFQLGNGFVQSNAEVSIWENRPNLFIGGLHNKSYWIKPVNKNSKLISVNFKPNCARYFIPDRLNLFKNKIVSLDDVFRQVSVNRLNDIQECHSIGQSIELIETFLISIFNERPKSRIDYAVESIYCNNGFVNINKLAREVCLSHSQFRRRFNEEIGTNPKEYSKIIRVKYIGKRLSEKPDEFLTKLCYEMGYFDQSHFIKDFKSITGFSPKNYLASI
jgi:AraC-like DNA-binding protein